MTSKTWVIGSILIYQIVLSTVSLLLTSQVTSVKVFTDRSPKGGVNLYSFDRKEIKSDTTINRRSHDSTDNFYNYTLPTKFKNDRISIQFRYEKKRPTKILEIHLVNDYCAFRI